MATVEIDTHSGFCLGVVKAIQKAEHFLEANDTLLCLGDIVHNNREVERLESKGMRTIRREELEQLHDVDVLFRAHGEPPSTYELARKNHIRLIDATCPVVLSLQKKIRMAYDGKSDPDTQIVIFGKKGHAEVVGLLGQTNDTAIVLETVAEAGRLDFTKPIILFSQTTKSLDEFQELSRVIQQSMAEGVSFQCHDSICRQVANRLPHIRRFAGKHDCILFVSGAKSSNGKALFEASLEVNPRTYFITGPDDVKPETIRAAETIGICGATSTPSWLMEEVKKQVESLLSSL
jgi:4-hydroxy-3-methylbut-2-enyl diphosphate reductase